jgi:hypothetical protein
MTLWISTFLLSTYDLTETGALTQDKDTVHIHTIWQIHTREIYDTKLDIIILL